MSKYRCCVPMCSSKLKDDILLHRFPNPEKDPERFRLWVLKIGGDIVGMNDNKIFKTRRVCTKHFHNRYLYLSNRISKMAVPQLQLPAPHRLNTLINQDDDESDEQQDQPSRSQVLTTIPSPEHEHCKRGVTLHRFPNPVTSTEKFNTWLLNIGGDITKLDANVIFQNRRVCSRHFEDIHKYPKNRLSSMAVPLLHLMSGSLHHFPNPNSININILDKYAKWKSVLDKETQEKGDRYIYNNLYLCVKHFLKCYQLPKNHLTQNAIPTLNLGKENQSAAEDLNEELLTSDSIIPKSADENQVPIIKPPAVTESGPIVTSDKPLKIHIVQLPMITLEEEDEQPPAPVINTPVTSTPVTSTPVTSTPVTSTPITSKEKYLPRVNYNNVVLINKLQNKLETMTLRYKRLIKIHKQKIKEVRKKAFASALKKLPDHIRIFTNLQLKGALKPKGRRFTIEEKNMARIILKRNPHVYDVLKSMFVLPSPRSLRGIGFDCITKQPNNVADGVTADTPMVENAMPTLVQYLHEPECLSGPGCCEY